MKTKTGETIWNLGIEKVRDNTFRIHMPNQYGEIENFPFKNGWSVSWPLNPHFTGPSSIISILQGTDKFKGSNFIETKGELS